MTIEIIQNNPNINNDSINNKNYQTDRNLHNSMENIRNFHGAGNDHIRQWAKSRVNYPNYRFPRFPRLRIIK